MITSAAHPNAAVAAAQEPGAVVVQPVPASVVAAQGSSCVLSSTQSPLMVNPLQLPDIQTAMVELKIRYEVEKARSETLEAVVTNQYSQVGELGLPKMENLSGFDLSHSILNQQGIVGTTQPTRVLSRFWSGCTLCAGTELGETNQPIGRCI